MTKVECPGPGFKGLKWKWIQDHAKEQQEREKEQQEREKEQQEREKEHIATQQVHLSGTTQPLCQQLQLAPNSNNEPLQPTDPLERYASARLQLGGGGGPPQLGTGNPVPSQPGVKLEAANGCSGFTTSPRASLTGDILHVLSDGRVQVKEEQESKALGAGPLAASAPHAAPADLDLGSLSLLHSAMPATDTSALSAGVAALGVGVSVVGSGVSPTPTMPATGLPGRKSMDITASIPAASVSLSPVALTSLSTAAHAPADASHGATTAAMAQGVATIAAATTTAAASSPPPCGVSPPSAPAPGATYTSVAQLTSAAPVQQPPGTGSFSAPTLASGAARLRLPPTRGPSMTVAVAVRGGDDFESMFTPLLSIPSVKSETPRAGIASRSSSLLPGLTSAAGGVALGVAVTVPHDTGGPERKAPLKKGSRMQDGRSCAGQPSTTAATGFDLPDGENGPSGRSRTPVAQLSPVAAGPAAAAKDAPANANYGVATVAAKTQSQCQAAPQPNSQQPAQQLQQQQRALGAKHVKDGGKLRESGEGAMPAGTAIASETTGPAAAVGGGLAGTTSRGGATGDRAPASAGSTPAPAPAHSGDAGDRKRPRSEGSKPKPGASLTSDPLVDTGWPYGETLADRIKRAKRAATSSSDQDGPHSHGGSAERHTGHAVATAANAAAGDGQGTTICAGLGARCVDEPRPTVSAEAQSRGADTAAAASNPARGVLTGSSGPAVAATGAGGANSKQQQQLRLQPPAQGRGKTSSRQDDPTVVPPTFYTRSGFQAGAATAPDNLLDQPSQNPAGNNLRMSGGGAVTDSSGGGGWSSGAQRVSGPVGAGKTAAAGQPATGGAAGAGAKRPAADPPPSSRRHNAPSAKFSRSDPHIPRPHQPHVQERREGAAVAGSGRGGSALPPPPAGKAAHRGSSGPPLGRVDGVPGPSDGQGPPTSSTLPGQAPAPAGPPPPPPGRPVRLGDSDTPAAGSCKGQVVAGSRGSKDGAGDKGACGPRHASGALDAVCAVGGNGAGGAGAAATTTTEPKTDSDTRTSRVVECFFEFDHPCRIAGVSASISGLGSSGSLQGGHGLVAKMGSSRLFGGGPAAAAPLLRGDAGGGFGAAAAAQLLDLGKIRSYKELWTQLSALYDGILPDEMDSKLIYLDEEGDWIMVTPDEPWSSVAAAATKVLVTNRT